MRFLDGNILRVLQRNQCAKKAKRNFPKKINGRKMKKSKEIIVLKYAFSWKNGRNTLAFPWKSGKNYLILS
jgi:hypothetical protein